MEKRKVPLSLLSGQVGAAMGRREGFMRKKSSGYVLGITAFLACPCHLPLTLPLLITLLGSTAWGAFLSENAVLVYGLATAYFVLGLVGAMFLAGRERPASEGSLQVPGTPDGRRFLRRDR